MIKKLLLVGLLGILLSSLLLSINSKTFGEEGNTNVDEMARLTRSLNLINGLYLSNEQMEKLIPLLEKAGQYKKEFDQNKKELNVSMGEILPIVNKELSLKSELNEDTKIQLQTTNDKIIKQEDKFRENMISLVEQAKVILTDKQLAIISDFRPCLVPKVSKEGKIGQAGNANKIEEKLDKIRSLPVEVYEKNKEKMLAKLGKHLEKHFSKEEMPGILKKIEQVVEEARSLDDMNFELKKSELAQNISSIVDSKIEADSDRGDMIIAKLLLNPSLCGVFKERMKGI